MQAKSHWRKQPARTRDDISLILGQLTAAASMAFVPWQKGHMFLQCWSQQSYDTYLFLNTVAAGIIKANAEFLSKIRTALSGLER